MTSTHNITLLLQPHFEQGLELWLEGEMLRFKAPKEILTPALMGLLKQNKEAILAWLKAEQQHQNIAPRIVDEYPLAFTQGAIWMLYRFAPNSPAYNTTFACVLNEAVNETAVRQAFHALLIRHPVLRSTFVDTDLGPRQRVWDHLEMPLQLVDGNHWNETELDAWLNQEADAPFDLQTQSCLRVKLIRNSVRGDILIATIHHVGADLWALLIVAKDIREFYQRAARGEVLALEPLAATYRQHVEWQQQFMDSPRGRQERRFWQRTLQGAPMQVSVPPDFTRPPVLLLQSQLIRQEAGADTCTAIRQFCKRHGVTPFVFVQTALQLLVHARTGAQDFLLGTPTMGRSRQGMDQVVGDFANPVVLRAKVQPQRNLLSLLQQVRFTLLAAMEHQEYPFPAVVQDCNPPRDSSRTPLFQLMIVWHQGNGDMLLHDQWIKSVLPLSGPRGAPYDIMLAVSDLGERFELNWTYQTSLYRAETVQQLGLQLQTLLQQILLADAATKVADVLALSHVPVTVPCVRDSQLEQRLQAEFPQLRAHECCVIVASMPQPGSRLFIGCNDPSQRFALQQTLDAALPALQTQFALNDVALYPQLPRTADGEIDFVWLAQRPMVDRADLQVALANAGYAQDDLLVLRQLMHLPTFDAVEMAAATDRSASTPALRKLDISSRPDAWVAGDPLPMPAGSPEHLFAALQQTAERFPGRGLILLDAQLNETRFSYAQLVDAARIAAAGFQRAGIQPGAIVLLQMPFDQRFFAVWWGAVLAGIRPLNVAMPEQYSARNGVAQKLYNVAHNFTELTVVAEAGRVIATQQWLGEKKTVVSADALLEHDERCEAAPVSRDPVAFLQLTSGSTGTPKAIQITHRGILHHVAASALHNHYSSDDISLNWLPFDHVVPILTTHIKDCVLGIQQVQLPTVSVLNDPLLWLNAMSQYRVTYSWAPNFAYQRVVEALRQRTLLPAPDLSCVKILMNAGEQVLAPVVTDFQTACEPFGLKPNAVQPAFGMAEACTCMTYNNESDRVLSVRFNNTLDPAVCDVNDQGQHGFVDLGSVVPGVEIRITNDGNELVKEGVIGRLQIRGPVVTPGYLNNAEANAEAFVGDEWFNSGDLGFIWNRRLVLTGREKEMIVVRGANYYCFELEQVVANIPGVVPTFVAATGAALQDGSNSDALVLFYVSDNTVDATVLERQILARVAEAFGVTAEYVIAVARDDFYKTTSGKIQRGQFKKNFEKGQYAQEIASWNLRHRVADDSVQTVFTLDWRANAGVSAGVNETAKAATHAVHHCIAWPGAISASLHDALALGGTTISHIDPADADRAVQSIRDLLEADPNGTVLILTGALPAWTGTALAPEAEAAAGGTPASFNGELFRDALWPVVQAMQTLVSALRDSALDDNTAQYNAAHHIVIALAAPSAEAVMLFKPLLETLRQETGLPALRGAVVAPEWTALQQLDALCASASSSVPVWLNADAPCQQQPVLQPVLRAVDVLAGYQRAASAFSHTAIRRGGTYLVTGGLGGLARPLCEWLAREFKIKLILSGRSSLESSPARQARFQQLKMQLGQPEMVWLCLPDFRPDTLHAGLSSALQQLDSTRLDGVFHLGGQLDMQPLSEIEIAHWQAAASSKMVGAFDLAQYLQQHWPVAILVQYGSLNSYFGGQSAAAYSVACAAQVFLTDFLNQHTSIRSWCLNWSVWQGVGMAQQFSAAEIQMARNKGMIALDAKRDAGWLGKILQLPAANYYIGVDAQSPAMSAQLDWIAGTVEKIDMHLQPALQPALLAAETGSRDLLQAQGVQPVQDAKHLRSLLGAAARETMPRVGDPVIAQHVWRERWRRTADHAIDPAQFNACGEGDATQDVPPVGADEIFLCQIWSRVLARPVTDVTRSFFEYGGHSINATQLIAAVNQHFGSRLTVAHLFQYPSVRELALSLRQNDDNVFLSLALQDCIARADGYRLDCINPTVQSDLNILFLPTAAGICSAYLPLMSRLKDMRLYTLSLPLTQCTVSPVADFAEASIRLIEQTGIAPESIVLVGWSMGGVLGYEILQQWSRTGGAQPALLMLDSGFGQGLHPITFDADFQLLMFAVELGLSAEYFSAFNQQNGSAEKLRWLQQYLTTLSVEVTPEMLLEWSRAYCQRLQNLERHVTEKVSTPASRITLIKAAHHPHGRNDLGWGDIDEIIKWHSVEADHQSIVKHPDVAEVLRQICQQQQQFVAQNRK